MVLLAQKGATKRDIFHSVCQGGTGIHRSRDSTVASGGYSLYGWHPAISCSYLVSPHLSFCVHILVHTLHKKKKKSHPSPAYLYDTFFWHLCSSTYLVFIHYLGNRQFHFIFLNLHRFDAILYNTLNILAFFNKAISIFHQK